MHPLLVRCAVDYRPKNGESGPTFRNEFTLTPDGVYSAVRKTSDDAVRWGVTSPILENDGRPLASARSSYLASTGYSDSPDRQNFLALSGSAPEITAEEPLRSTSGDLRPLRVVTTDTENRTYVSHPGPLILRRNRSALASRLRRMDSTHPWAA